MFTVNRNHPALPVLFAIAACSSTPSEGTATTQSDDGTADGGSVTEGITLNNTSPADGSGSSTDSPTDPVTDDSGSSDPTSAEVDTSASGSTTDAESSSSAGDAESSSTDPTMADLGDTIYEVQDGTIATDMPVEINGVVITGVVSNGVYAQEPGGGEFSGVFVFSVDGPDLSGAQLGDVVNLSGVTAEYMDNTEVDITLGTYELVESGTPLDSALVELSVLADPLMAEPWEGVLVRAEGDLVVTSIPPSNEFVVNDGANDLRVDDFLYELPTSGDFAGFAVGASFTAINGPLNYFNGQFKIAGRGADDFEGYSAP